MNLGYTFLQNASWPSLHPVLWCTVEETLTDHLVELTWVVITHCLNLRIDSNLPFIIDRT
jgi:hypothetical protein